MSEQVALTDSMTGQELADIFITHISILTAQIERLEVNLDQQTKLLSAMANGKAAPAPAAAVNGSRLQRLDCTELIITNDAGELYFKIKGINPDTGEDYQKWGIRVWPEILTRAGIQPPSYGCVLLTDYVADYTTKANGQPDKIVNMELKEGGKPADISQRKEKSLDAILTDHKVGDKSLGAVGWLNGVAAVTGVKVTDIKAELKRLGVSSISHDYGKRMTLAKTVVANLR